jgi:hypothetical protein
VSDQHRSAEEDLQVRRPDDLRYEHEFAETLATGGIACPHALVTERDEDCLVDDEWLYEVTTLAPGDDRYQTTHTWGRGLDVDDARQLGRTLAQAHLLLDGAEVTPRARSGSSASGSRWQVPSTSARPCAPTSTTASSWPSSSRSETWRRSRRPSPRRTRPLPPPGHSRGCRPMAIRRPTTRCGTATASPP